MHGGKAFALTRGDLTVCWVKLTRSFTTPEVCQKSAEGIGLQHSVEERPEREVERVQRGEFVETEKPKTAQVAFRENPEGEARKGTHEGHQVSTVRSSVESFADDVMGRVLEAENLKEALKRVRKNKGAPGIDGMTVDELPSHLRENWQRIREELAEDRYQPSPVRSVEIPKRNGQGVRVLGIPTVLDRFIQQALLQILSPMFDSEFSKSSYGFRPGRSAHQAIRQAKSYVEGGHSWVVDIDLENFFNQVHHDRLMARLWERIKDKRVLHLIRRYLKAGIMMNGVVIERYQGTPQGGPLSPWLSNVVLDEMDKELEKRGHRFCRYGDDCNIYVRSERAGKRVMESIRGFLEKRLKLKVNETKSAVARAGERKFLSFSFYRAAEKVCIRVAKQAIEEAREKIRRMTYRVRGESIEVVIKDLNEYLKGWIQYFGINELPSVIRELEGWIRRRLRALLLKQWKRHFTRYKRLRSLGLKEHQAWGLAGSQKGIWRLAGSISAHTGLNRQYFRTLGLLPLTPIVRGL